MRVLIVTPWMPYPRIAHAGGDTLFHIVRSLVERGHTIHMLCYGRGESTDQVATIARLCTSLEVVTPAYSISAKVSSFVNGGWRRPWLLGRRANAEVRRLLGRRCIQSHIDVVHLVWTEMGRYLDAVPCGVGTVLGTLDVESRVRAREVPLHPLPFARWATAWRTHRLIRAERHYVAAADAVTVCSPADREQLATLCGSERIHVVPPWLDAEAYRAIEPGRVVPGRLTFVGALDRIANAAAVRFLITDVWPRVRAAHPAATLNIVGANPPRWLCCFSNHDPSTVVTGWVPDLPEVWAQTDVAVCPSLVGGGLLLKVAQPMCAGRPVVTTALGNEGVAAPSGALAVADSPEAFAAAVLRLLADRALWTRMAQAARQHIAAIMDWEMGMRSLETAYASAISAGGGR